LHFGIATAGAVGAAGAAGAAGACASTMAEPANNVALAKLIKIFFMGGYFSVG
jgi:hypothetical protein